MNYDNAKTVNVVDCIYDHQIVNTLGHNDSGEVPLVEDDEPQLLPGLGVPSLHVGQDAGEQGAVLHTGVEDLEVIAKSQVSSYPECMYVRFSATHR